MLSRKKKIGFTVVALILAFVFVEGAMRFSSFLMGEKRDMLFELSAYRGKPWARAAMEEYGKLTTKFSHYVEFRVQEYHGTYINVSADSSRKTWNPPDAASGSMKVYVFGGSTVFGWVGPRDEHTFPSEISRALNQSSSRYVVSNYGQPAYNTMQNILTLILLLKDGHRPDVVILHGGYNDILAAYENGAPGAFMAENLARQRLDSSDLQTIVSAVKGVVRDQCQSCVAATMLVRKIFPNAFRKVDVAGLTMDDAKTQEMAHGVDADFRSSAKLLHDLAAQYGFRYEIFWQPATFLEDHLVGDEARLPEIDWRMDNANLKNLYRITSDLVRNGPPDNFMDISGALRERTDQVYLDSAHVSEEGNTMLARPVAEAVRNMFNEQIRNP